MLRFIHLMLSILAGPLTAGEIIFVRHGETVANQSGRYTDATINRLTATGTRQADELVKLLGGGKFTHIAISPARRCLLTAEPFLRTTGSRASIWPELEEISNRTLSRTTNLLFPRRGREIHVGSSFATLVRFDSDGDRRHFAPEGKKDGEAQIRMAAERLRDLARPRNARILVIGHSIHGSRLLEILTGEPPKGALPVKNAAPTRLHVARNGTASLVELNGKPVGK